MEENIKIKLNIGDRIYPLTVQRSQEFYFREAAKIILAMCCIQFAAKNLQNKSKSIDSESEVEKMILKIIDDIDKSI